MWKCSLSKLYNNVDGGFLNLVYLKKIYAVLFLHVCMLQKKI